VNGPPAPSHVSRCSARGRASAPPRCSSASAASTTNAAASAPRKPLDTVADPEADPEAGPDPPTAASAAWYTRLAALRRARFAFAAAHAHNRLCEAMLAGSCTEPVTVRYQPMLAFAVTASILASVT